MACEGCKRLRERLAEIERRWSVTISQCHNIREYNGTLSAELADRDLRDGTIREAVRELMRLVEG